MFRNEIYHSLASTRDWLRVTLLRPLIVVLTWAFGMDHEEW